MFTLMQFDILRLRSKVGKIGEFSPFIFIEITALCSLGSMTMLCPVCSLFF